MYAWHASVEILNDSLTMYIISTIYKVIMYIGFIIHAAFTLKPKFNTSWSYILLK